SLDLPRVDRIIKQSFLVRAGSIPSPEPVPESSVSTVEERTLEERGKMVEDGDVKAICEGKLAVVLLSGGQGTRLGSSEPKGCFNIGLPSGKSLFQLQAERILRVQRLAAQSVPDGAGRYIRVHWYIMTSPFTHDATRKFFESRKYFGLESEQVTFFQQGTLPCISKEGRIIMETPYQVARAPDGNGGVYSALKSSKCLEDMAMKGIKYIDCYGVDNALVRVADPLFLGYFMDKGVATAAKVVRKAYPQEKVGVFVQRGKGGSLGVLEYSEMDHSMAYAINQETGRLRYNLCNVCLHMFTLDFLTQVTEELEQDSMWVLISILLFADDVVLLASSLMRALALFCDLRQLTVNLGKTKVMVFNGLKTSHLHFFFREAIALSDSLRRRHSWYAEVFKLLGAVGIRMDHLPPFWYSLDTPNHLLPTKQEMKRIIREDIYRQFIRTTWVNPQGGLCPKMAFYAKHFLKIRDSLIIRPQYTFRHWMHALPISLGQFRVGSHRICYEMDHHLDRLDKIFQLCNLHEAEMEHTSSFSTPLLEISKRASGLLARAYAVPHITTLTYCATDDECFVMKNRAVLLKLQNEDEYEILREEEFAPVKNANGYATDTPETSRLLVLHLHTRWVIAAGGFVTHSVPYIHNWSRGFTNLFLCGRKLGRHLPWSDFSRSMRDCNLGVISISKGWQYNNGGYLIVQQSTSFRKGKQLISNIE
ncbi:hypothetical protein KI387_020476, partial [Taxus chinensis]